MNFQNIQTHPVHDLLIDLDRLHEAQRDNKPLRVICQLHDNVESSAARARSRIIAIAFAECRYFLPSTQGNPATSTIWSQFKLAVTR